MVYINFYRCYSYVGNIEKTGGQELNLGEGCLDVSVNLIFIKGMDNWV